MFQQLGLDLEVLVQDQAPKILKDAALLTLARIAGGVAVTSQCFVGGKKLRDLVEGAM